MSGIAPPPSGGPPTPSGAVVARVAPSLRRALSSEAASGALWAIPPVSAVVGAVALLRANPARIGELGLVSAIPVAAFASIALLTAGFVAALLQQQRRPLLLAAHVAVLVFLLDGAPALIEPEPRFATAWLHAGFTDYIAGTGHTLPQLDARFNWPGFFTAAALLLRGVGIHDPATVLRWAPVAFDLAGAAGIYAIAAALTRDPRVPWLAAWLFVPANWVGQDYFSPQAFAFVLFLGFLYLLLRHFRRPPTGEEGEPAAAAHERPAPAALLALLLLVYAAIVWSHQLTPFFAIAATVALVVLGATRLRTLPVILVVIAAAFLSYLAEPYWAGHLRDIFGGFGQIGSAVSSNVGGRVSGSTAHELVSRLRIVLTIAVMTLALLGAARLWRSRRALAVPLALLVVPYSVVAVQSYGGEALLRAYLFSLPAATVLGAVALAPRLGRQRPLAAAATAAVTAALVGGFFVARYGNELFEMVRPGEAAALAQLARTAPPGSTLVALDENVPWRSTALRRFTYEHLPIVEATPRAYVGAVRDELASRPTGGYLVITTGQREYARLALGVPQRWLDGLDPALAAMPSLRLVDSNADAQVYRYVGRSGAPVVAAAPSPGAARAG